VRRRCPRHSCGRCPGILCTLPRCAPGLSRLFSRAAPAPGCAPAGQRGRSPPPRAIPAGGCDPVGEPQRLGSRRSKPRDGGTAPGVRCQRFAQSWAAPSVRAPRGIRHGAPSRSVEPRGADASSCPRRSTDAPHGRRPLPEPEHAMPRLPTITEDAVAWSAVATSFTTRSSTLLVGIHRAVPGCRDRWTPRSTPAAPTSNQVVVSGRTLEKLASCGALGGHGTSRRRGPDRRPGARGFDRRARGILTVPPIGDAPHRVARSTHESTRTQCPVRTATANRAGSLAAPASAVSRG
jgi:hypothetical protein